MRVLILSHGHPDLGAGGAERAGDSLFQKLKSDPTVEQAIFVARAQHEAIGHSAFFGAFRGRPDEILACPPPVDGFTYQTLNYDLLKQLVEELVQFLRPDVVHVHHFLYWGLEIFELFKKAGIRVVFTLHEYAAVCVNHGQMIKTGGQLCHVSSPAECSACYPSMSAGKFFVRKTIATALFAHVDQFVAPSQFLKDRYVAWGVEAERIAVLENVMDQDVIARSQSGDRSRAMPGSIAPGRIVLAFFGQINPYKGVDILLQAASMLSAEARLRIEIRLYGENKHFTEGAFAERLTQLLAQNEDVVRPMGAYRNRDVIDLMRACDWILIPSIWWENSPIVIQEARLAGRPILCSDIGGMAEKIDPDLDLVFSAGNSGALASMIEAIAQAHVEPDAAALQSRARRAAAENTYAAHRAIYGAANALPEVASA